MNDTPQTATGSTLEAVMADTAVELRGYFKYDSGYPYRIWTVTRDVPEVPVQEQWLDETGGPRHVATGDELREDRSERGQFYKLERDGFRVGLLEWWQVGKPIFGGTCPPWRSKAEARVMAAGSMEEAYNLALAERRARAEGTPEAAFWRAFPGALSVPLTRGARTPGPWGHAFIADGANRGAGIAEGDVVVHLSRLPLLARDRRVVRGSIHPIPRDAYPALIEGLPHLRLVFHSWLLSDVVLRGDTMNRLAKTLRRSYTMWTTRGQKWSDETSSVAIVRPWVAPVSHPVVAKSDAEAIMMLVEQVGGRLQNREG
jgi:hypothetical protein